MDHSEVKHLPKVDHTPAELDASSLLLLKAAAYIETHGHCKSQPMDGAKVCLSAALTVSDDFKLSGTRSEAYRRVAMSVPFSQPIAWNDADERTQEEVVAKLRAVALGL